MSPAREIGRDLVRDLGPGVPDDLRRLAGRLERERPVLPRRFAATCAGSSTAAGDAQDPGSAAAADRRVCG